MKSIVLLSGGMDSGVCLAREIAIGNEPIALNITHGQSHPREIEKSKELAEHYEVEYMELDLTEVFKDMNSYLTGKAQVDTYVPFRNGIFLTVAAGIAEDMNIKRVVIGAHKEDAGGYPDTTVNFIKAMNKAIKEGTKNNVNICAPFVNVTKDVIVKTGTELGFPFEKTITCYNNEEPPCGRCNACKLRAKAFKDAGVIDPVAKRRNL